MTCTRTAHEQRKADPAAWATLPLIGYQDTGPGEPALELRNCTCGSTLAMPVARRPMAQAVAL